MITENISRSPVELKLWISATCLTLFHNGGCSFLQEMNYLASYLQMQARAEGIVVPQSHQLGIVFMVQNLKQINSCINNLHSPDYLDRVIICFPAAKEFMILNEMELNSPDIKHRLHHTMFMPSGLIHTLRKQQPFNPPESEVSSWEHRWKIILEGTDPLARELYWEYFGLNSLTQENTESAFKSLLWASELNVKALWNLIESGRKVKVVTTTGMESLQTDPKPCKAEANITGTSKIKARIIIPGQCSYELCWKPRRPLLKRDHQIDEWLDQKAFIKMEAWTNRNFLTHERLQSLDAEVQSMDINATPMLGLEKRPRMLSFDELNLIKDVWFRRWQNADLWNPNYSLTKILDTSTLKLWNCLHRILILELEEDLQKRGNSLATMMNLYSISKCLEVVNECGKELRTISGSGGSSNLINLTSHFLSVVF
ncbi:Oidioi.mRNA.OKI2018_I69.XSR.g14570.t1.cds [Oikopleura dioica]|uniref:Oidioi.mRNA.OKI2018_I69.XSR.g14570.t1.cds n=1 Tax=Oikopleura dioica TaxID=34765 RepID=A0ABN7SFF4_OIKDI|nr:Oidioi.mRNA.OKI2018_I69.XSR.g14570.t1.cds [Oikopleura dioica]